MDSGYAGGGNEEDGDEAKQMGETYATMVLALYIGELLVKLFQKIMLWITVRTYGKVVECACVIVSFKLS